MVTTIRRVPIPATQDPFVNTPLVSLGSDGVGPERFWISSWNSTAGSTGVVVDEHGEFTVHRFAPPHSGFYSAVAEDSDTLWLCGDLSMVVRFSVATGEYESYPTGAPPALVFSGMAWDPQRRKLFAAAFPPPHRVAVCFDTAERRTTAVHRDFTAEHYQRASFGNGDGTQTSVMVGPGLSLVRWDPGTDEISVTTSTDVVAPGSGRLESGPDGRIHFPGRGWFDPARGRFTDDGPTPDRELEWFAFRGERAWGVEPRGDAAVVGVWDLTTGAVRDLCTIADGTQQGTRLTASGDVVAMSMYGEFSRYDGLTGERQLVRQVPTDAVARVDCLRRVDRRRVLGTPFITQRFWSVDLDTGEGADLGRAAPGTGEVLRTWLVNGTVYLAAYAGGQLTAFDPQQPSSFPVNPRVVADPGTGMRPIADAVAGSVLYYACSHHYGDLGGVITRFDTIAEAATHLDDPVPDRAIQSLVVEPATGRLVAGTTVEADCQSATPVAASAAVAVLDPVTLVPQAVADAPAGVGAVTVVTPIGDGTVVCQAQRPVDGVVCWFPVSADAPAVPPTSEWKPVPGRRMIGTGRGGLVVVDQGDGHYALWHVGADDAPAALHHEPTAYHLEVQDDDVLLVTPDEVVVLDGVLAGRSADSPGPAVPDRS